MNTSTNLQQNFENIQSELDINKVLFYTNDKGDIIYEEFRDITNYEGLYQASNIGRVKGLDRYVIANKHGGIRLLKGIMFKQQTHRQGYSVVGLHKVKETKIKVHQLVALAFLGHTLNGHKGLVVDHKNNIKSDNRLENLQLITQRENSSKDKDKVTSKYVGVIQPSMNKKFVSQILANGKHIYLGSFDTEIEASEYYQNTLKIVNNGGDIVVKRPKYASKHKGICFSKASKKWISRICKNGNNNHIGYFKTEQEAYEAREVALKAI